MARGCAHDGCGVGEQQLPAWGAAAALRWGGAAIGATVARTGGARDDTARGEGEPRDWRVGTARLLGAAGRESARIGWRRGRRCRIADRLEEKGLEPWDWRVGTARLLKQSAATEDSRCWRPAPSLFPSLYLSPSLSRSESTAGRLGMRIPAHFPARVFVENRRLGDDYRRHMKRIHGALDASIFSPPRRLGSD